MKGKETLKLGLCQFDIAFAKPDINLKKAASLIEKCDADIIVLPELFTSGYLFTSKAEVERLSEKRDGKTIGFLKEMAKEKKCFIFAGFAEKSMEGIYNSSALIGYDGSESYYRKSHLFYEEKLYFLKSSNPLKSKEITLKSGLKVKVGLMICFDWMFPETARTLSLDGSQILLHAANLVMPYCPAAMVTRCIENAVYSVTCNRIGIEARGGKTLKYIGNSRIISPKGDVLAKTGESEESSVSVEIDVSLAKDKQLNTYNNLFEDRRVDLYKL